MYIRFLLLMHVIGYDFFGLSLGRQGPSLIFSYAKTGKPRTIWGEILYYAEF